MCRLRSPQRRRTYATVRGAERQMSLRLTLVRCDIASLQLCGTDVSLSQRRQVVPQALVTTRREDRPIHWYPKPPSWRRAID